MELTRMTIASECNTKHDFNNFSDVLTCLDEFGLTPNQFRVYCHLWRVAQDGIVSDESSESIAKVCRLTRVTVIRVLSQLAQMHFIECARAPGKRSVFYLMPCSDWRSLALEPKNSTHERQSKVIQLRSNDPGQPNSDTCKPDLPVNEINTKQETREPPLKRGSLVSSAVKQAVNEIDVSNPETGSLDEKLANARERGWAESGTWWNDLGQQMVTVNRFVVSVTEFMQRSLDSFDVGRQVCESGLRMCREQIERIKQRKSQQLCDQAMAIAMS
ncbi:MAG: hypothetical protein N4J56_007253 [Chroococcidiopsis sp. SAG 2025]|uniref:hypothetical protein n=1 Tax=Chroococcidiopsis sp. SAG 2025 TaxID=171389 RepID=UPI0029370FAA|nr:hypothetical protein [Chroococcidiopsis sp. SAG 2025]MDV2997548.1 hypothetical protein [Chroococcidiopsis sp. SAG 2025]